VTYSAFRQRYNNCQSTRDMRYILRGLARCDPLVRALTDLTVWVDCKAPGSTTLGVAICVITFLRTESRLLPSLMADASYFFILFLSQLAEVSVGRS
jgi:hypothetical protein